MQQYFLSALLFLCLLSPAGAAAAESHALSLYGDIKYPDGFTHFDYVNPDAPKGGTLRLGAMGTFDNLNPYIIKGAAAVGIDSLQSVSLMTQSYDEPFTMYGYVAEKAALAEDRTSIKFYIRKEAVWDDEKPITAGDVVWTFHTLMKDGAPFYRAYYADVKSVTALGSNTVEFTFSNGKNRELPLIVAQMPIFPAHDWAQRKFGETTLTPMLSGGPYKVGQVKAGQSIEFLRKPDWWGQNLAINKGRYNFDKITFTYYRDQNVLLEAFFAGNFDVQQESVAKLWATAYDAPPVQDGRITKKEIANTRPSGMQAFVYNVRRPQFEDTAVRKALGYAFDFEWENKQFAYGAYTRTRSYFENSELAATGLPDAAELQILEPLRENIPPDVYTSSYAPPQSDGSGNNRALLKTASDILDTAGYTVGKDGIRINDKGTRLSFEILSDNPAFERWVLPFIQNLKKIGVEARFRVIDDAQYQNRMRKFDYDVTVGNFGQSDSPGNEQREYWTSAKADIEGSRNIIGIKNTAIDALVESLVAASTREELIAHCRALDRVLQWNYFVIPHWSYNKWRLAWWSHLQPPEQMAGSTPAILDTWWVKP